MSISLSFNFLFLIQKLYLDFASLNLSCGDIWWQWWSGARQTNKTDKERNSGVESSPLGLRQLTSYLFGAMASISSEISEPVGMEARAAH